MDTDTSFELPRPQRMNRFVALFVTIALAVPIVSASPVGADIAPKWDKRIAELADFVERKRGLDFKDEVPVRFLTERQFTKEITGDRGDLTKQDKKDLEQTAGLMHAVGLAQVSGDQLFDAFNTVDAAGTLAFYDQETKKIVIRGKELDVATKATVVHELTHALQDQHFDLTKLDKRAGKSGVGVLSLVEGDAIRIEDEYVSTLSQRDQEAYGRQSEKQAAAEGEAPTDVPAVLQIMDLAPYSLGPTFVEAIIAERGERRVDDAFKKPPKSDKQVMNPSSYLKGDDPARVRTPKLGAGETKVGAPDTFGALGLYLMLAGRVDPAVALSTITNWGGDSFVQFKRRDTACIRAAFTGKGAENTARLAGALEQWAVLGPGGAASVERAGNTATLTTCDPGGAPDDARITSAGDVLDARAFFLFNALGGDLPATAAECVADRLAVDPELLQLHLNEQPSDADLQRVVRKVTDAQATCPA